MRFGEAFQYARADIFNYCKMLRFDPYPHQAELLQCVQQESHMPLEDRLKRITVKSGQGPGKTAVSCIIGSWRAFQDVDGMCVITAPTQRQVKDVWMAELRRIFVRAVPELQRLVNIDNFSMQIAGRKDWGVKAVASSKTENVQGYHQDYLTFILDEASGVPRPIWETVKGTLTNPNSLLVAIGNPNEQNTAFYDTFNKDADEWHRFTWNAELCENVDQANVRKLEREFGKNSDVYRVRVLGEFPKSDPNAIIASDDVYACNKNLVRVCSRMPVGTSPTRQIGLDFARFGGDESVIVARRNSAVVAFEVFQKQEPAHVVYRAFAMEKELGWKKHNTWYVPDAGGMGQGVMHLFPENNRQHLEFHSQGTPQDGTTYADKISEAWFHLRELTRERSIYLPKDGRLVQQLSGRVYKYRKGLFEVESKDKYKERIGTEDADSPDRADGLILAFYPHVEAEAQVTGAHVSNHRVGQKVRYRA